MQEAILKRTPDIKNLDGSWLKLEMGQETLKSTEEEQLWTKEEKLEAQEEHGNILFMVVVPEPIAMNVEEEVQHEEANHEEKQGEPIMTEEDMALHHQMENDIDKGTKHEGETNSDTLGEVDIDTDIEFKEKLEQEQ